MRINKSVKLDEKGSTLPMTAMIIGILVVCMAFTLDLGVWREQDTKLQEDVDMAAFAVKIAKENGMSDSNISKLLQVQADRLPAESGATTFTMSQTSDGNLKISGTRTTESHFSRILGSAAPTLNASAELASQSNPAPCVLATNTNPSGGRGIELNNNASMTVSGCTVQSNASGANSVHLTNGFITVSDDGDPGILCHGGGVYQSNGNALNATKQACPPTSDPLASQLPTPTPTGTVYPNDPGYDYSWWGSKTFNPGIYQSGFTINNGRTYYLNAGTYFITGGNLMAQSGAKIIANGPLTIIVMNGGKINITDYAGNNNMQAPTTGPYAGILLWRVQHPSCNGGTINFQGGADFRYDGVLYFPGCTLEMGNDAEIRTNSTFTYVLADRIKMVGASRININVNSPYGLAANLGGSGSGGQLALVK